MIKKVSKHIALSLFLAATSATGMAQELKPCATDEMVKRSLEANPSLMADYLAEEARLAQLDQEAAARGYSPDSRDMMMPPVYTIPVVFHILHQNGIENISDAQVHDAMRVINEDFSKTNADFANTVPAFVGIAADCEIVFRLAQKDPSGNCTNGIDRIYSAETNIGDDGSKLNQWPRNKYLNIWVVKTITSGAAGYAYLPGTTSAANDGIMILHNYVGSIGTGNLFTSHALPHEIGHHLNLKHTWGSTNNPGVDCSGTDNVTDTPPTMGWTSCNLSGATCGSTLDNVQNFMEYSYCSTMFTEGQKTRMRAALTSSVAQRSSLWTSSNLTATGVSLPAVLCAANFTTNRETTENTFCAGGTVTFTDLSYNGTPTSWAWSFPGGTPSTDNSPNPTITYNTPGIYDVTLTVSNSSGSVTATKSGYIVVNPTTAMVSAPMFEESFESGTPIPNSLWRVKNGMTGTNTWEQTTVAAATGTNSVRIINTTASDGQEDELIGPSIDMTALTGSAAVMTFKVAHAQKTSTSADKLQVYVSTTCGETWSLRKVLSGAALSTAGVQSTSFTPTASQWVTQSVNLSSYAGQPNLYFMFRFTSDGGNNVYIDDINILANVGVEDMESALNMNVFPNPADGTAFISFDMVERADVTVELTDLVGRKISSVYSGELSAGEQKFEIAEAGSLTAGMYLVTLNVDGHTFTKKLMVH